MGFGIDHAAMINVLAHQLLSGLGTKPVRLTRKVSLPLSNEVSILVELSKDVVVRLANYQSYVNNKNFDFKLRTTRPMRHNLANQNENCVSLDNEIKCYKRL